MFIYPFKQNWFGDQNFILAVMLIENSIYTLYTTYSSWSKELFSSLVCQDNY